jgi:hypothetical protein
VFSFPSGTEQQHGLAACRDIPQPHGADNPAAAVTFRSRRIRSGSKPLNATAE